MDNWTRRLGIIRYPKQWVLERPFELMAALHEFIVLDARYDWPSDSVEATGLHPMFEVVDEGFRPPYYDLRVSYREIDKDGHEVNFVINISPNKYYV